VSSGLGVGLRLQPAAAGQHSAQLVVPTSRTIVPRRRPPARRCKSRPCSGRQQADSGKPREHHPVRETGGTSRCSRCVTGTLVGDAPPLP